MNKRDTLIFDPNYDGLIDIIESKGCKMNFMKNIVWQSVTNPIILTKQDHDFLGK